MNLQRLHFLRPAACAAALALLAACGATPDKPVRATLYDFGPGLADALVPAAAPALLLADVDAGAALESNALLYRLAYADAHQLHPYANARWSAAPAQLVRSRLRDVLGRDRPVLDASEAAALGRAGGSVPRVLRVDLEEFAHQFDVPAQSFGVLRLRATLLDNLPGGERLVAQRTFVVRRPAPSADASGGVRALTAAVDAAGDEMRAWIAQQR